MMPSKDQADRLTRLIICLNRSFAITDISDNVHRWFSLSSELLINTPVDELFDFSIKKLITENCLTHKITIPEHISKTSQALIHIEQLANSFVVTITPIHTKESVLKVTPNSKMAVNQSKMYFKWNYLSEHVQYCDSLLTVLKNTSCSDSNSINLLLSCLSKHDSNMFCYLVQEHVLKHSSTFCMSCAIHTSHDELIWANISGSIEYGADKKASEIVCSIDDVVENKALLSELKKQNNYLSLAESLSNSGHWRYDVQSGEYFWSKELYRIMGKSPKKYTPALTSAQHHQGKKNCLSKAMVFECIEKKIPYYSKQMFQESSGAFTYIETIGEVELNGKGDVIALFGICRDITKEERVFEKLKLLAMVNYTIKVPIFFINDKDKVVYQDLSPQTGSLSNLLFDYVNFSIDEYLQFKKLAKEKGQIKKQNISFDKFCTVFNMSITYECDEGIFIWIVEDVTDRFKQEQQQVISNRLALLGNTFGGVSHDINNVLGVALGSIEMLEMKSAQGVQNITPYIDRVKNAIDKGKSVTERLLAFTKRPTLKIVEFNPIQELLDNKYLFSQVVINTIEIEFNLEIPACTIFFPQGEFINILLNLVINSQDAIQEEKLSGKIVISANIIQGSKLQLHVKDSGIGIKDDALSKIFDPFYSSKSLHKGNGIGLANVYSTMYKHNGEINVLGRCELGGAHFCLEFPCNLAHTGKTFVHRVVNKLNLTKKKILILDDEVSIAEFVALFLEGAGAETVTVNTKLELESIISKNDDFELFITDMILPDLTGRQAAKMVLNKMPDIQVFAMSGYLDLKDEKWDYPVLRKPFNSSELTDFLMESID